MLRLLLVTCLLPHVVPPFAPAALCVAPGEDKAIKALDEWMKLYRAGKIDLLVKDEPAKDRVAKKYGLGGSTDTWARDLQVILDEVKKLDDAAAAQALLEVAAVGIDQGKYTHEMAPAAVREAGEIAAGNLKTPAAKEEVCRAARGEVKIDKARAIALRAAAAKVLGLMGDRTLIGSVEPLLADANDVVRYNAAEAYGKLADEKNVEPLIELVRRESTDAVLLVAAQSLKSVLAPLAKEGKTGAKTGDAPAAGGDAKSPDLPDAVRPAVEACNGALGRATWRADMALVAFLDQWRSPATVPALIGLLERFKAHPEEVKTGKLSGLLQFQVHELLVSMTGAVFPASQPEKWRQFWETEKDNVKVTEKHVATAGDATSGDFCGIPIQGTRVVFILDLSGSMDWSMRGKAQGTDKKNKQRGIDFAKQELKRAVGALSQDAYFNLITINGDDKPELWNKDLVIASDKNRDRFLKFLDGLKARGGTNLWAALAEAMKIKSLVYGSRYESNVDEIFLLSDGAPSVGEVIDPMQILRLVKETNRFTAMRINTVFVNTEPPDDQRQAVPKMEIPPDELMKRLAEQNGGKYENL